MIASRDHYATAILPSTEWENAEQIALELREGNRDVFSDLAHHLEEMVHKSDPASIAMVLAVIVCLLPREAQTPIKFGDN